MYWVEVGGIMVALAVLGVVAVHLAKHSSKKGRVVRVLAEVAASAPAGVASAHLADYSLLLVPVGLAVFVAVMISLTAIDIRAEKRGLDAKLELIEARHKEEMARLRNWPC